MSEFGAKVSAEAQIAAIAFGREACKASLGLDHEHPADTLDAYMERAVALVPASALGPHPGLAVHAAVAALVRAMAQAWASLILTACNNDMAQVLAKLEEFEQQVIVMHHEEELRRQQEGEG